MNIGFVGKAGAGKSFLCNYLRTKYQYVQAKMATSVYAIAEQYFGMDKNKKDRRLLQVIGTDVGRTEIDYNIWVKRFVEDTRIAQRTYEKLYDKAIYFCSDDVRFLNEFKALKDAGWVLIYLDVPDAIRLKRLEQRDGTSQIETLNHVSELEIDTFKDECIKVDASGTLDQTYERLEETLEFVRQEKANG